MVNILHQNFIRKFQKLFHKPVYITLRDRKEIDIANLKPQDIDIDDIKCALFNIARFNGHSSCHYSVGEHSVNCFRAVIGDNMFYKHMNDDNLLLAVEDKEYLKAVFAHDFSEAYCGDIITPIKNYLGKKFANLENKIHKAISLKFNINFDKYKKDVKLIDSHTLDIEIDIYKRKRQNMDSHESKMLWRSYDCILKEEYQKYFDIICKKLDIE